MANFICKVMTPQGQVVKVNVEEQDKISCLKLLKRNNMIPINVEENPNFIITKKSSKISAKIHSRNYKKSIWEKSIFNSKKIENVEIKEFTEELLLLLNSEFSIKEALSTIINKTENLYFKEVLKSVLKQYDKDGYLYRAMKEYKKVFPLIYINLIKTGELTNSLPKNLDNAIIYFENEEKLKEKLYNELIPNCLIFIGIIIGLFVSVFIGIPALQGMMESFGKTLYIPKLLKIMFNGFNFIIKYWFIFIIAICIVVSYAIYKTKDKNVKIKLEKFKYKNKLLGKILFLFDFSRIMKSIYMNLKNKMRIQDALEISKHVVSNKYIDGIIEKSITDVYEGKSWINSFENEKIISPIVINVLKKANGTNSLDIMKKAIDYCDIEIDKELNKSVKKMEKISYLIIIISIILFGIFVLIPCIQLFMTGFLFI